MGAHTDSTVLKRVLFLPCLLAPVAFLATPGFAQEQSFVGGQFDLDWQQFSFPVTTVGTPSDAQQRLTAFGTEARLSAGMPLSKQPDAFTFSWTGTWFDLSGHSSSTSAITNNPFVISAGSPSSGNINLEALTDGSGAAATSDVSFVDSAGAPAAIYSSAFSPTGPNSVSQYAVSPTALGAAFAAVVTNGSTPGAAAYGGYADNNGLLFGGVNESDPGTIHSWRFVRVTGYTQSVWLSKPLSADDSFAIKIGATYLNSRERFGSGVTFDLNNGGAGTAIPPIGVAESGSFDTESGGPMLGLQARLRPQAPFFIETSATTGISYFGAKSTTHHSFILPAVGSIDVPGGTQHDNGMMGLAGLDVSFVFPLKQQIELRLLGGVHASLWAPRPTSTGIDRTTSLRYNLGVSLAARF